MAKKKSKSEEPSLTYRSALQELEEIMEAVENEELDVDELSTKVQHAMNLIQYCQQKLKHTEDIIQQAFEGGHLIV